MYKLIRPLLFVQDAESVHNRIHAIGSVLPHLGALPVMRALYGFKSPALRNTVLGLDFPSPVGLAAGFDKPADLVDVMPALGFGFTEIGTVTPRPQPGNERPRLFRLREDNAIINRMGFNCDGMEVTAKNLEKKKSSIITGVNIGKNKDTPNESAEQDYIAAAERLVQYADYITINVSSPNTPGLRELQDKKPLKKIVQAVQSVNEKQDQPRPILLKIAPDMTDGQLDDVIAVVKETGVDGIIATNTTSSREGLRTSGERVEEIGAGGLSGPVLARRATDVISYLYKNSGGEIAIVGVGGIDSAQAAYDKIRAGASLVQLYTGLVYEGPGLVKKINKGLVALLEKDGFSSISEAIGANHQ